MSGIRKFGLKHCDLPTSIANIAFFMKIVTLKIDGRDETPIPKILYLLTFLCGGCYLYVHLVSIIWFVFFRCAETGDMLAALLVFSLGIGGETSNVKFLYMYFYIDEVHKIVADCLSYDSRLDTGTRFAKNLLGTMRDVKKRAIVFWIVIIANGILYIVKPILIPGRHFMDDVLIIYGMEPMFDTPNYQISFVMMAAAVSWTCYLSANISAFLIIITGYVQAQMIALSKELNHMWEDAEENYQKTTDVADTIDSETNNIAKDVILNEYVKIHLKEIAIRHIFAKKLVRHIEGTFRAVIAMEFFLLMASIIALLLAGLEKTYMQLPFTFMQIGMDCLIGQRLIDASAAFEEALYDCKWERFDRSNMKSVYLMLVNSQKSMTMSAGGVTILSYFTFMNVIKSIYSTYTTLRSTMN